MINTMKKVLHIILFIALLPFATANAQLLTDEGWQNLKLYQDWQKYHYRSKDDMCLLREKYFRDTISVDEMEAAFRANHDKRFDYSPYQGHDSIFTFRGNMLCLVRPKAKGLPLNQIYMNRSRTKEEAKLLDGDLVFLRYPRCYMGYVVSAQPLLETYDKGHILGREGILMLGEACFFSQAQQVIGYIDGTWESHLRGGTILMGILMGKDEPPQPNRPERTFSVLLYEKPGKQAGYDVSLLEPDIPDEETQRDFRWMKRFVEKLPQGTFMPYYSTDFRILPARYYRVTVNKCGWLVEDYMDINGKNDNMKTMIRNILLLAFMGLHSTFSYAQWDWCHLDLENAWGEYKYLSETDLAVAKWRHFRDTVTVDEMKGAFMANHAKRWADSSYMALDSIETPGDKSIVLKLWPEGARPQDLHNHKNRKHPFTGAALLLHNPQHYMGFIVSPYPTYEVVQKGKLISHSGTPYGGGADFFSYAQQSIKKHDGLWSDSMEPN